ncbi:hypothetical protein VYH62_08460 [Streptococcus anginosus]|nr:hypothetical protein [Streptococcus anginosus]MED5888714.1 hypothetical protein [Streptococcus anginosus]MED5975659.1 hypothetical protein [Streptococcus anginosus]
MTTAIKSGRPILHSVPTQNNDIMEVETQKEGHRMSQETYSKTEIDLKLDKISSETQHGFKQMDLKFDNLEKRIENLLLSQENKRIEEEAKNRREFTYWFIGILVSSIIGIAAIIVTILTTK